MSLSIFDVSPLQTIFGSLAVLTRKSRKLRLYFLSVSQHLSHMFLFDASSLSNPLTSTRKRQPARRQKAVQYFCQKRLHSQREIDCVTVTCRLCHSFHHVVRDLVTRCDISRKQFLATVKLKIALWPRRSLIGSYLAETLSRAREIAQCNSAFRHTNQAEAMITTTTVKRKLITSSFQRSQFYCHVIKSSYLKIKNLIFIRVHESLMNERCSSHAVFPCKRHKCTPISLKLSGIKEFCMAITMK